jgi:hypothetical protein
MLQQSKRHLGNIKVRFEGKTSRRKGLAHP